MSPGPQLIMRRPHLRQVPAAVAPAGYELRHFRPGDEAGWNALMDLAFERRPGQSDFAREMADDDPYRPERVKLLLDASGAIVATASCWVLPRYGDDAAVLHWVARHPGHRGRGLGRLVSLAVLHQAVEEGRGRAFLQTDDFRVPALRIYLRMGFEPVITHRSHPGRWRRILHDLDWPERFEPVLSGPREHYG